MDGSSQIEIRLEARQKNQRQNRDFLFILAALALALLVRPSRASVQPTDTNEQSYDAIVNDLSRQVDRPIQASRAKASSSTSESFETVMFHGGVGLAGLAQNINLPDGKQVYFGQKGIQVSFGIDLFSPNWLAEGTYRNFAESDDSPIHVGLQEFEMKLVHKEMLSQQLAVRAGGGLSARYLSITEPLQKAVVYTTPSGIATLGVDLYINEKLSVGLDLSGRSAMISETPDHASLDATMRMDAHF